MHTDYLNPVIRQLRDQQVRFAPREKKIEQVDRAEKLLAELEPERTYTYEYLCYRITDYPARVVSGPEAVAAKTQGTICGCSSRTCRTRPTCAAEPAGERVLTVEELSKMFQRLDQDDFALAAAGAGQPAVRVRRPQAGGFLEELGRPIRGAATKSASAAAPVQPTDRRRARRDHRARAPLGPGRRLPGRGHQARCRSTWAAASRRFATRSSSSTRTIPTWRFSPTITGRCARTPSGRSTSSTAAASRSRRWPSASAAPRPASTASINEMRAKRIMELPLDYIPQSDVCRAERREADPGPDAGSDTAPTKKTRLPSGLPPYLASLYEVPLLTREQEVHLFRKMNYLKYKASKLRAGSSIRHGPRAA